MGRHKEKNAKKASYNLDVEIIDKIKEFSEFENVNQSEFIEVLVTRWDEGLSPESKLKNLFKEKDEKQKEIQNKESELKDIENKIKIFTDKMMLYSDLKRQRAKGRPQAIKILETHLKNNNIVEAEKVAKHWQKQTGISAFELLFEARNNLADRGELNKENSVGLVEGKEFKETKFTKEVRSR